MKRKDKPGEIARAVDFCKKNTFINAVTIDMNKGIRGA